VSAENVEAARRGFEAAMRGDLAPIEELLDPDVKWHGGDPASGCQDKGEALSFIQQALDNGIKADLVDVIDAGDRVVVVLQREGDDQPRANLTTFRNGKVVEMIAFEAPAEALAAAST
jgi:ketosteroid isomerase-like protein